MMDKDSSYLNRFCFGKGRRSGCNRSTRSLRSSSHPGPWWTSAADLDFCWNFFDNEGSDHFSAATSCRDLSRFPSYRRSL